MNRITSDELFLLNPSNVLITKDFLNSIFKKYNLNITVKNLDIFIRATTHQSYCKSEIGKNTNQIPKHAIPKHLDIHNIVPLQNESYERLEFLGDAMIHSILGEYLYDRYPTQNEGFMTILRTKLENMTTLSKLSKILGLHKYILISRYLEDSGDRTKNEHLTEDGFEAFIGAIYKDTNNNYDICKKLIHTLIETELDIAELLNSEKNYKALLLEYAHKMKMPDPLYGTRNVNCQEHKIYEMFVQIQGDIVGIGSGVSKKIGEQNAAKCALKKFNALTDDSDASEDEYVE